MKVRITTLLSLTGVFVAGSAAALVNTQVLSSTALRKSTASEISVADTQPPTSSTAGTAVDNKFAPLAPNLVPTAPQTTFDVAPAGTVVLDSTGGVLTIVAVNPAAGWAVAQSDVEDGKVEVKLQSATQLVEFTASLIAGQIVTTLDAADLTATSVNPPTHSTVSGTPTSTNEPLPVHRAKSGKADGGGSETHSGGGSGGGGGGGGGEDD
jgi:hypothetical protein